MKIGGIELDEWADVSQYLSKLKVDKKYTFMIYDLKLKKAIFITSKKIMALGTERKARR